MRLALSEISTVVATIKELLARDYGVGHVTLEMENVGGECAGSTCELPPENLREELPHVGHHH